MKKLISSMSAVMMIVFTLAFSQSAFAQYNSSENNQGGGGGDKTMVAPMEDIMEYLRNTSQRSSRAKKEAPYALPMMDIGKQTATGFSPESMDINGDGMEDLVLSFSQGAERYQAVLLNTGEGFEATYLCGYTNANDSTGQFTYRGDCAEVRQ